MIVYSLHGERVAEIGARGAPLDSERGAAELIAEAIGSAARFVAIPVERLSADFFELSTRKAGQFIQKFVNYRLRLAILGDISDRVAEYRRKRDLIVNELKNNFEIHGANGAFYLFVKTPWGTGTEFVAEAIRNELLIIPGNVFSQHDSHFRLSFAAEDDALLRGAAVLRKIARR